MIRQQLRCGDQIKAYYYSKETCRGRITTETICVVCYTEDDIVSKEVVIGKHSIKRYNQLPVCRTCFDYNINIPTSCSSNNVQQRVTKNKQQTRPHLEKNISKVKIKREPAQGDK